MKIMITLSKVNIILLVANLVDIIMALNFNYLALNSFAPVVLNTKLIIYKHNIHSKHAHMTMSVLE